MPKAIQLKWDEGEQVVKVWESSAGNRIGIEVVRKRRLSTCVVERADACSAFVSKRNAKVLRDWLNVFLAEDDREQLRRQLASVGERVKELERERDDARAKWRDDQLRADNARLAAEVERLRVSERTRQDAAEARVAEFEAKYIEQLNRANHESAEHHQYAMEYQVMSAKCDRLQARVEELAAEVERLRSQEKRDG